MTQDEKRFHDLGRMVIGMIQDLRKQAKEETGYARRAVTFPGGEVQLFVVNDVRLADIFDAAVAKAYEVAEATPGSQVN